MCSMQNGESFRPTVSCLSDVTSIGSERTAWRENVDLHDRALRHEIRDGDRLNSYDSMNPVIVWEKMHPYWEALDI